MLTITTFQIGKSGITENVIASLKNAFKNHKIVRVSLLKSASTSRNDLIATGNKLVEMLGGNFSFRTIGFTIVLRKQRDASRVVK